MIAEKQSVHVRVDSFNVASHKNHEEVDVDSAVRKAIENAQESIRIAMVSVGRKQNGLKSFSNKRFKDSFNGEGNMEDDVTAAATSSKVSKDFLDAKKLSVAKMIMDEINGKIEELTKECSIPVTGETESRPHDSAQKDEYVADTETTIKSETVKYKKQDDYQAKIQVEDQNDNENAFKNKKQDEEVVGQKDVENAENDKGVDEVFEWLEHENESKDDHDTEIFLKEGNSDKCCDHCELKTETNMPDESEVRQENNEKSAGDDNVTEEILSEKERCIIKTFMDQTASDENEYEDTCDIRMEESEVSLQEDNITVERKTSDESCEEEFNEKSAGGDKVSEEYDITVEATQNVDDVPEASGKFQTEDAESMEGADESEANDVGCVKTDFDESNKQKTVSGQDHFRRIYEEATAKERERVKNKLAIERAVSEARDRASAGDRERAERQRAAVKEAIEEARQRKMAEARETVAKSKRKAERAAVERVTSEARQRALEKAMHQRTVSRLAENLDAEIKRWSNGKEGNLRALLSTLQYILGPDSGWQPVSLAHIMTTSDVKKAYRKATLCVHPGKLQQRGATIQHKYICEKVFDLLKTAWKRLNSEER